MSTDPEFKDITIRLNGPSTSPLLFKLTQKQFKDSVTGNWRPGSSNEDQYPGSFTLEVKSGDTKYDRYYIVFSQDDIDDLLTNFKDGKYQINKLRVFEDSNRSLAFDKRDRVAGVITDVGFIDIGDYIGSNTGDWKVDAAKDKFAMQQGGRLFIEASQDFL